LAECEKLLKDYPQPRFTRDIRYRMAAILSNAKRYPESEKELRRLLEQDPNDARACNFLGYELADQSRNLDEAERLVRRAIDLDRQARRSGGEDGDEEVDDSDSAAYLDSLGWVLFRQGKYAEARQWLEKATAQPDGRQEAT